MYDFVEDKKISKDAKIAILRGQLAQSAELQLLTQKNYDDLEKTVKDIFSKALDDLECGKANSAGKLLRESLDKLAPKHVVH